MRCRISHSEENKVIDPCNENCHCLHNGDKVDTAGKMNKRREGITLNKNLRNIRKRENFSYGSKCIRFTNHICHDIKKVIY